MKPPSSHAEALRREQAAQVRAAHGFLMTADELGDFERGEQSVRQALEPIDGLVGNVIVDLNSLRIRVQVFPHRLLRGSTLTGVRRQSSARRRPARTGRRTAVVRTPPLLGKRAGRPRAEVKDLRSITDPAAGSEAR